VGDLFSLLPCPARRDSPGQNRCAAGSVRTPAVSEGLDGDVRQPNSPPGISPGKRVAKVHWSMGRRVTVMVLSFLSPNVSCDPSSPTIRIYDI
jgi:hypothetical protein